MDSTTVSTVRMMQIAARLGALAKEKARAELVQWQHEQDLEARKVFLTPPEGWPGKNAEARELEQKRAYMADEVLQKIYEQLALDRTTLADIGAEISALTDERRALEKSILVAFIEVLDRRSVYAEQPVEETAPDEMAIGEAMEEAARLASFGQLSSEWIRPEPDNNGYHADPSFDDIDIPF